MNHSQVSQPGIKLRTQFTFMVDDVTLSCILSGIAENSVNIAAFFTTKDARNANFVRLVVGSSESESAEDLSVVVKTLKSLQVRFKEEKVIALSTIPAGIPGGYNRVIGSLWCKTKLKSFYVGENNIIYINVSNIRKAIEILSNENLEQCPKEC
ncbi:hypothetical protein [Heyndrickxia vini]|uniref:ACT domain-containing protein n=1 Tax=Heyndrickxia vini TaxID=1476025 RepID=A0ABX7DZB0_9BACI|nr:hypothetical protein [Heyndrickxia vini]QQZ08661.1 hypothetical protein I5776_16725 [Heyndrickxia vini]